MFVYVSLPQKSACHVIACALTAIAVFLLQGCGDAASAVHGHNATNADAVIVMIPKPVKDSLRGFDIAQSKTNNASDGLQDARGGILTVAKQLGPLVGSLNRHQAASDALNKASEALGVALEALNTIKDALETGQEALQMFDSCKTLLGFLHAAQMGFTTARAGLSRARGGITSALNDLTQARTDEHPYGTNGRLEEYHSCHRALIAAEDAMRPAQDALEFAEQELSDAQRRLKAVKSQRLFDIGEKPQLTPFSHGGVALVAGACGLCMASAAVLGFRVYRAQEPMHETRGTSDRVPCYAGEDV